MPKRSTTTTTTRCGACDEIIPADRLFCDLACYRKAQRTVAAARLKQRRDRSPTLAALAAIREGLPIPRVKPRKDA